MSITIIDRNGHKDDVGPFEMELTAEERAELAKLPGLPHADAVDLLYSLDDDRPDPDMGEVAEAFDQFGEGASLEIRG